METQNHSWESNCKAVNSVSVNPMVSLCKKGIYAKVGDKMEIVPLRQCMDICASGSLKSNEKNENPVIMPYMSNHLLTLSSNQYDVKKCKCDGIVFVDIDKSYECGLSYHFYKRFKEICSHIPNLLCMHFSHSHNLHLFLYDPKVVDFNSFNERRLIWSAYVAKAIKEVLGFDVMKHQDMMDAHQQVTQKFLINDSPYKWNDKCCAYDLPVDVVDGLKREYPDILLNVDKKRRITRTTQSSRSITGNGGIVVNKEYSILGYSGFDARSVIGPAIYYHFNKDEDKTYEFLSKNYSNDPESGAPAIWAQLQNMIRNNTVEHLYRKQVEQYLFGGIADKETVVLEHNQYLNDVISKDDLSDKYIYIKANPGAGKTELIKKLLVENNNIIFLQLTRALRDGKKQGIEVLTYGNSEFIKNTEKAHTTIDVFVNQCSFIDLSKHMIVVDESHLLEDYIGIDGRREKIKGLLELLSKAKQIVFMSATPNSDIILYPFKLKSYIKEQNQKIIVHTHPLTFEGKGSIENARYSHMIKFINKLVEKGEKVIVYSNKYQEQWKKYGFAESNNVTYFNSNDYNSVGVQSILKDNKLINPITLATKYLGVGVEIKKEKRVHIVFDLNEGWKWDFIVQALGRPRDAEEIIVECFHNEEWTGHNPMFTKEKEKIKSALRCLIPDTANNDQQPINLIAARMLGIFDNKWGSTTEIQRMEMLVLGNKVNERNVISPYDIDLFTTLPYKQIDVKRMDTEIIDTDGKKRRVREENELVYTLLDKDKSWWDSIDNRTYDEIFDYENLPYVDRLNARKIIKCFRKLRGVGVDVNLLVPYMEVRKAVKCMMTLIQYCAGQEGEYVLKEFEGCEVALENINKDFKEIKKMFSPAFISHMQERISKYKSEEQERSERSMERYESSTGEEQTNAFIDWCMSGHVCSLWDLGDHSILDTHYTNERWNTFVNSGKGQCRKVSAKLNGQKGGRKQEAVTIVNANDGSLKTFASKQECKDFLNLASATFCKFLQGKKVRKVDWYICA